jgi:MFS family permease
MNYHSDALKLENRANTLPVKATLLLISTLTVMSGATIAPSLPAMQAYFKTVPNAEYLVRLALTLPALFIALGAPIVGMAIDRFGRKPILLFSLLLYGIAGSSGYLLNSLESILIGRAFLGISVAGIMTIATTLVGDYYQANSRAQFLGLQSAFMGLGGVLFLSLGGFIASFNWRFPFLIYQMALVLLPCAFLFLPEPNRNSPANQNIDRVESSVFPLTPVAITYGIALVSQIVFYLIPVQLPFYLQQIFSANSTQSGLAIALSTLFSAVSSLNYRRLKGKIDFTAIYGISFINIALGYALIAWAANYLIVGLGLILTGLGLGLLMPNMNFYLTSIAPDNLRGRILSGITTAFFLGQFLSPLISQPLSKSIGLGSTYGWAALLMVVLTGAVMLLLRRPSAG